MNDTSRLAVEAVIGRGLGGIAQGAGFAQGLQADCRDAPEIQQPGQAACEASMVRDDTASLR